MTARKKKAAAKRKPKAKPSSGARLDRLERQQQEILTLLRPLAREERIATLAHAVERKHAAEIAPPFIVPAGAVEIRGNILSDYGAPTKADSAKGIEASPGGVLFQGDATENTAVIAGKEILHMTRDEQGTGATLVVSQAFAETNGLVL